MHQTNEGVGVIGGFTTNNPQQPSHHSNQWKNIHVKINSVVNILKTGLWPDDLVNGHRRLAPFYLEGFDR